MKKLLALFESFTVPVWVFDIDQSKVYWANDAALSLWDANSLEDLCCRDMSKDMSPSVSTRLRQYQEDFQLSKSFVEPWTLYPNGHPHTFQCHFSGIEIEGNKIALLGMMLKNFEKSDSDSLRSTQALLLTTVMISLYDNNNQLIYANPAARSMLGTNETNLTTRFVHQKNYLSLLETVSLQGEYRADCLVNTANGEAWHELTVQHGPDAVTGNSAYLVSETNIDERKNAQQQVKFLAYNDALTGLANRTNLINQLNRELKHAHRYKQKVAVLFLDLDRFKAINDTLGHDIGDELLIGVADSIVKALYETDTVARLGGDEFICIVRDIPNSSSAAKTASRILHEIAQAKTINKRELFITASIGVSIYPSDGDTSETIMKHADVAMYQAKALGGNTVIYFDAEMNRISEARLTVESELRKAQYANEFEVFYQPRLDSTTEKIVGVEALLRWHHPQRGLLNAEEFIAIAEDSGILADLDNWVLLQAAHQQVLWKQQKINLKISINISARQFKSKNLLKNINQILVQSGCSAQDLELEITESVYMGSEKSIQKLLNSLHEIGLTLAVDDFGTGYSNLAYLQNFPIDCLKIDQMFVQDNNNHALLEWIISLGNLLKVKLVAEGVETNEQIKLLKRLGCHELQGFYYSAAISADAIKALILQRNS